MTARKLVREWFSALLKGGSNEEGAYLVDAPSCDRGGRPIENQGFYGNVSEERLHLSASSEPRQPIQKEAFSLVVDKVFMSIVKENNELEGQRAAVPGLLKELSQLAPTQARLLIQNNSRYQVWVLAEELLEECRRGWTEDPARSEEVAHLALEVAGSIHLTGFRELLLFDLKAEAWSYIGNCRRIQSDLSEAGKAFQTAEDHLRRGSGDHLERARFCDLKASLMAGKRDYGAAESLLGAAIRSYRDSGEQHLEGRALLKLAKFFRDCGRMQETIPVMERAEKLLDPETEPWLLFVVKNNLITFLTELGRTEEANGLLPEVRKLARSHGTHLERLRLLWTEAVLRKNLGQVELAEEALKQVRAGFIGAKIGYDVALVSLDLAALYLEAGRTEEVRKLATEIVPLFASRGIHREVVMAWNLFREAATRDAVTLRLVEELASRIRNAENRCASAPETR